MHGDWLMQSLPRFTEIEAACRIPFTDAVKGATVKVNLKGGTDVKIPAGESGLLPLHLTTRPMQCSSCQISSWNVF